MARLVIATCSRCGRRAMVVEEPEGWHVAMLQEAIAEHLRECPGPIETTERDS